MNLTNIINREFLMHSCYEVCVGVGVCVCVRTHTHTHTHLLSLFQRCIHTPWILQFYFHTLSSVRQTDVTH
jgi:hypothetical protein